MESKDQRPIHLNLPTCDGCVGAVVLLACADPFTGQRPYRFSDHALGTWNEAINYPWHRLPAP